jgi:hypothetical protein
MESLRDYFEKRISVDEYDNDRDTRIIKKIVNDDYYLRYGINKRKQLSMDLYRAKAEIDISKLVPKDVKCVFFTDCKGLEMPKLPDTVEVLFIDNCYFKKFYFPKNLKELYFISMNNIKTFPDLSKLKKLWSLDIQMQKQPITLPKTLPDSIKYITLGPSRFLKSSMKFLPLNLEAISVYDCDLITKVPDLRYLKNLRFISVGHDKNTEVNVSKTIKEIKGLHINITSNSRPYKF